MVDSGGARSRPPVPDRRDHGFVPSSDHNGADVAICPPHRPQCKGVAEAAIRFIGGRFGELGAAEPLRALPALAFPAEIVVERQVSRSALVALEGNRYSVPPSHAGRLKRGAQVVVTSLGRGRVAGGGTLARSGSPRWRTALRGGVLRRARSRRSTTSTRGGMFDPAVVGPAVEMLAELAGDGAALEFAIGTGRIALPLAERGVRVAGIDSSEAMLARLREKPGAERLEALVGDMAATRVDGEFSLVYLVFNTIFNLTTQDGQVACFENAAAHLRQRRAVRDRGAGAGAAAAAARPDRAAVAGRPRRDVLLRLRRVTQRLSGQHYYFVDGGVQPSPIEMRYAWPAELDLMARLAGMRLEDRWAGWSGEPFTGLSPAHVSVYEKR